MAFDRANVITSTGQEGNNLGVPPGENRASEDPHIAVLTRVSVLYGRGAKGYEEGHSERGRGSESGAAEVWAHIITCEWAIERKGEEEL